jgi:Fe-S-cluster containining protein
MSNSTEGVHDSDNPCLSCGACCAHFRVSFHWMECASASPEGVPDELTSPIGPHRVAMLGTLAKPARCIALEGEVGKVTRCTIHAQRSTPCRNFPASWWETGEHVPECDDARRAHNLPPLLSGTAGRSGACDTPR